MRPLISNVSAFHKLLFVRPLVCSYPSLCYLKAFLLVRIGILFTTCYYSSVALSPSSFSSCALLCFAPAPLSFRSYLLFPFVPILILFHSYPCFFPFLSIVSLASIRHLLFPCGLSLPLRLRLAVFIQSIIDARCSLSSICSRFKTLCFVPCLYSFTFPSKRTRNQY